MNKLTKVLNWYGRNWHWSTLLFILLLVLFSQWLGDRSKKDEPIVAGIDVQPTINKKETAVDSLMLLILNRVISLETSKKDAQTIRIDLGKNYQESMQAAPDTCKYYINSLYKNCNRLDSTNRAIIQKQDSSLMDYSKTTGEQADIISLTRYQLQNARDSVQYLNDEVNPKGKKKIIKVLKKVGEKTLIFLAGVATGKVTK